MVALVLYLASIYIHELSLVDVGTMTIHINQARKLDRVAPLVADPPRAKTTSDNDKYPIGDICDTIVNLIVDCIGKKGDW